MLARNACPCVHADRKNSLSPSLSESPSRFLHPPSTGASSRMRISADRLSRRPRMSAAFGEWGRRGKGAAEGKFRLCRRWGQTAVPGLETARGGCRRRPAHLRYLRCSGDRSRRRRWEATFISTGRQEARSRGVECAEPQSWR